MKRNHHLLIESSENYSIKENRCIRTHKRACCFISVDKPKHKVKPYVKCFDKLVPISDVQVLQIYNDIALKDIDILYI